METLTIVLPIYNERDTIEGVLREWIEVLTDIPQLSFRFVLCEDGSTDGTSEFLPTLTARYPVLLNQQKTRRGYGQAVIAGIHAASSRYVLCIDSDGQCDPGDFAAFWRRRDDADVLIGWRTTRIDPPQRKVFSRLFFLAFSGLFRHSIHDPSAPFVLFRKDVVLPLVSLLTYLNEGFWWGFIASCAKTRRTIVEIPINHRKRVKGETQVYHLKKIPRIALSNLVGLIRLRFARLDA